VTPAFSSSQLAGVLSTRSYFVQEARFETSTTSRTLVHRRLSARAVCKALAHRGIKNQGFYPPRASVSASTFASACCVASSALGAAAGSVWPSAVHQISPAAFSSAVLHSATAQLSAARSKDSRLLEPNTSGWFHECGFSTDWAHWGGSLGLTGAGFGANYRQAMGHRSSATRMPTLEHLLTGGLHSDRKAPSVRSPIAALEGAYVLPLSVPVAAWNPE